MLVDFPHDLTCLFGKMCALTAHGLFSDASEFDTGKINASGEPLGEVVIGWVKPRRWEENRILKH
jgi:hypothetical protein